MSSKQGTWSIFISAVTSITDLCSCRLGWVKEEEAGAGATKGDSTPPVGSCFVLFCLSLQSQNNHLLSQYVADSYAFVIYCFKYRLIILRLILLIKKKKPKRPIEFIEDLQHCSIKQCNFFKKIILFQSWIFLISFLEITLCNLFSFPLRFFISVLINFIFFDFILKSVKLAFTLEYNFIK